MGETCLNDSLADYAFGIFNEVKGQPNSHCLSAKLPFLDLHIDSADPQILKNCSRVFAQRGPGQKSEIGAARISVVEGTANGISPSKEWWEDYYFPTKIEDRLDRHGLRGLHFHDECLWQFYDINRRHGVSLMRQPGAYPPWEVSAPLRPFLHWIYTESGMSLVHAGSLGLEGKGVLIAGGAGAGKSGTTLAGIAGHLDSVGDDYVLLKMGDRPTIHPVYKIAKQDPAGLKRLGLYHKIASGKQVNWQGKYEFEFEEAGGGRCASGLDVLAILVPRVVNAKQTRLVPIHAKEAMLALAPTGVFQFTTGRARSVKVFADLVRRLPCYGLELSTNGEDISACVAGYIEGSTR